MYKIIEELEITHVMNCAFDFAPKEIGKPLKEYKLPEGIKVKHLHLKDKDDEIINFEETYHFIEDAFSDNSVRKRKVFVHCVAG